jgi:hypothetical protein
MFSSILGCKRSKTERTTIQEFNVADYEFEIEHVKKIDKWTGKIEKDYIDTVLVNVCDFCHDCENENDEPISVRR